MGLRRLLDCLCGSREPAEPIAAPNKFSEKNTKSPGDVDEVKGECETAEELIRFQQDVSGLQGSLTQKLRTLLATLTATHVTHASVYGYVADDDVFILLSASCVSTARRPTGSGPSPRHAHLLQKMTVTQRTVSEHMLPERRSPAALATTATSVSTLYNYDGHGPSGSTAATGAAAGVDPNSFPNNTADLRRCLLCAVPVFGQSGIAAAILLELYDEPSSSTPQSLLSLPPSHKIGGLPAKAVEPPRGGCGSGGVSEAAPAATSTTLLLPQLGLAASMALSSDADQLRWVSSVVHRVGAASNMCGLVGGLCEDLAAHVRRRFVISVHVRAALLPRPDASMGLLFQLQDPPPPGVSLPLPVMQLPPGVAQQAQYWQPHGAHLSASTSQSLLACGSGNVAAAVAAATAAIAGGGGCGGGLYCPPSSRLGMLSGAPSRNRLALATAITTGSAAGSECGASRTVRLSTWPYATPTAACGPLGPIDGLASSRLLALTTDQTGCCSPGSPSASRTIVVQLPAHLAPAESNPPSAAAWGAAPCLLARAFPLRHSLLAALAGTGPQTHGSVGPWAYGGATGCLAAFRGASLEDVAAFLQNVHNPSRDVFLIAGLPLPPPPTPSAVPPAGRGIGGASGCALAATAATFQGGTATTPRSGAAGGAGGAGGAAGGGGALQSLVLVGLPLGEAVLGFYMCFAKRLPAELLEAVREGCSELLEELLLSPVRTKLEGSLAPEYETLRSPTPGHFAVLRTPSVNGLLNRPTSTGDTTAVFTAATGAGVGGTAGGKGGSVSRRLHPRSACNSRAPGAAGGGGGGRILRHGSGCGFGCGVMLHNNGTAQVVVAETGTGCAGHQDRGHPSGDLYCSSSGDVFPFPTTATTTAAVVTPRTAAGMLPRTVSFSVVAAERAATVTGATTTTITATTTGAGGGIGGVGGGSAAAGAPLSPPGDGDALPVTVVGNDELFSALLQMRHSETTAACSATYGRSASLMTVTGTDPLACMRQQLDLLVTSIHTTMTTDGHAGITSYPADDLEQLELCEVLGKGGGGIVYRGRLGTQEVAVKVMELPDTDGGECLLPAGSPATVLPAALLASGGGGAPGSMPTSPRAAGAGAGPAGGCTTPLAAAVLAKEQLRARRALLRNAMEMAVQGRVSHPNLIQVYATYSNVLLERRKRADGSTFHCLIPAETAPIDLGLSSSVAVCCAIVAELADGGSLAAALAARTFPRIVTAPPRPPQSQPPQGLTGRSSGGQGLGLTQEHQLFQLDMKGVYMTLLDVALALKHLHSLNLVHRDIKPANLLLKTNPRDHRGFTVKLADFGFVLHLSETAENGTRYTMVDQACGTVTHMAPELLSGKARVETSVDIYSFGILMWELVGGGVRPFPHVQPDVIPRNVYKGARPTFSDAIGLPYRGLAQTCWAADPHRRPRASELVAHLTAQLQEMD